MLLRCRVPFKETFLRNGPINGRNSCKRAQVKKKNFIGDKYSFNTF